MKNKNKTFSGRKKEFNFDVFINKKRIGAVLFSDDGEIAGIDLPKDAKNTLIGVRDRVVKTGVTAMGDIIYDRPVKVGKDYIISGIWKELVDEGIELRPSANKGYCGYRNHR